MKGLGLGLAISRQLAEAHGGRLVVTSDGQTGSIFSLVLPLFASDDMQRRRGCRCRSRKLSRALNKYYFNCQSNSSILASP